MAGKTWIVVDKSRPRPWPALGLGHTWLRPGDGGEVLAFASERDANQARGAVVVGWPAVIECESGRVPNRMPMGGVGEGAK